MKHAARALLFEKYDKLPGMISIGCMEEERLQLHSHFAYVSLESLDGRDPR
ncbi:hypothetical protein M378DRAFT_155824, partial [Amanita muscaria Koide BX008]